MRLGQTSFIHFSSKFVASLLGFVATVYFARILGSGPLGKYFLVLALVSWLGMACTIGVGNAITKRISEGKDQIEYMAAGGVFEFAALTLIVILVFVFKAEINAYVGYPVAIYVASILGVQVAANFLTSTLNGLKFVHVTGVLSPIYTGTRSILQISALVLGFGLVGLFLGYIGGLLIVIVIGSYIIYGVFDSFSWPEREHFQRIFSFAKFSWIGNISRKAFNWIDVIVLGFFVPPGLVGIYSAAWNIGQFLSIFGSSLSVTLFPEISDISADENPQVAADLFETSLAYAGVFLIPGLVGGSLLGHRILRVYGGEFTKGRVILVILIVSLLIQAYRKQFLTMFNAVDRPEIAFRVNGFLILANVVLNIALVYWYGWIGAAIATTVAVASSLWYAYVKARQLLEFSVPIREISRELLAALVMGAVVFSGRWVENSYSILGYNFLVLIILIGLGAGVYFSTLLVISPRFRLTVFDNLPLDWLPIDFYDWE